MTIVLLSSVALSSVSIFCFSFNYLLFYENEESGGARIQLFVTRTLCGDTIQNHYTSSAADLTTGKRIINSISPPVCRPIYLKPIL